MNRIIYFLVCILAITVFHVNGGSLIWSVQGFQLPLGGSTWNTPVIMNNLMYFQGQDGVMVCLNAKNGAIVWKDSINFNPVTHHPIGMDGIIYTSNGATFIAVDGSDGSIIWEVPVAFANDGTPIKDSMIFVGTVDTLFSINIYSGNIIWKKAISSTSLLITDDGSELLTTSKDDVSLYGLSPETGDSLWALAFSDTATNLAGMALSNNILVVACDSNITDPSSQKYYGINIDTKTEIWVKNGYGYSPGAPPVIMGDKFFISTRYSSGLQLQMVRAHDLTTGDSLWANTARASSAAWTPIITALEGKVYYENSVAGVYPIGYICADTSNGDTIWSTTGSGIALYQTWGGLAVYDGKLYGAMDMLGIFCFDAEGVTEEWPMFGANIHNTNSYVPALNSSFISGTIFNGSTLDTIQAGMVYMYKYRTPPSPMHIVDSSTINSNGKFEISGIPSGSYLVKAVPDSITYPLTIPTYHYAAWAWEQSSTLNIKHDTLANVVVNKYVPPAGVGIIRGKTIFGNIDDGSPGDPYLGAHISLVDQSSYNVIQHTTSITGGTFSFSSLLNGSYSIYVDVTGVPVDTNTYNITTTNPEVNNIQVTVDSTNISFTMQSLVEELIADNKLNRIIVYPNPATEYVKMEITLIETGSVTVELFDLLGNKIMTWLDGNIQKGTRFLHVDLSSLPAGSYFYRVVINTTEPFYSIGKVILLR